MTKSRFKIQACKFRTVLITKILLVLITTLSSFQTKQKYLLEERDFVFLTNDSINIEITALFNSDSVLAGYKSLVFSPVCEDTTCYPVELYFYWDIFGNYQKYELPEGVILSKLDHQPFSEEDYKKLSRLLHNPNPSFWGMSKKELIKEFDDDSIDGYTGATIAAVKDEVIEGAVYSCYTLWHIAHGKVVEKIQAKTKEALSPELVKSIVVEGNSDNNYFLIDSFNEEDFVQYSDEVLLMIKLSKGYLAQKALEKIPDAMISSKKFQDDMITLYPGLDYYAQKSFLKRLCGKLKSNDLGVVLLENMQSLNSAHTKSLVSIFCDDNLEIDSDLTELFIEELLKRNISISRQQYKNILTLAENARIPKKELNKLKQNIN